ncbi:MAG: hypothetical protein ACR2NX_08600 [Chthoniobacterales bacterium]
MAFSFKGVNWPQTMWVSFLRTIATGLVYGIIAALVRQPSGLLFYPIFIPLVYFLFLLPIALLATAMSRAMPIAGLFAFPAFLCVVPGDPFVFALSRSQPKVVPVSPFRVFNFHAVILVEQAPAIT